MCMPFSFLLVLTNGSMQRCSNSVKETVYSFLISTKHDQTLKIRLFGYLDK